MHHRGRGSDCGHQARFARENGYIESFNAPLRDDLLDGEIFYTVKEAAQLGGETADALTSSPDQSVGTGQPRFTRHNLIGASF